MPSSLRAPGSREPCQGWKVKRYEKPNRGGNPITTAANQIT